MPGRYPDSVTRIASFPRGYQRAQGQHGVILKRPFSGTPSVVWVRIIRK